MIPSSIHPDSVHRLLKEALDSGSAKSLDEAERLFGSYRISIAIDATADSYAHQLALLGAVSLASRVFLGGVQVSGALEVPLQVRGVAATTLAEAVLYLGGHLAPSASAEAPVLTIGGCARPRRSAFDVRVAFDGWSGGVVPVDTEVDSDAERTAMPMASLLAAALAVNEVFIYLRRESALAGRRRAGLSLWDPAAPGEWLGVGKSAPVLELLPSKLWLLGLGHLGQAFVWALAALPYPTSKGLHLVLQDVDVITPSTPSTSILSRAADVGRPKTRVVAEWCERRGFTTSIQERRFDASFRRQDDEPIAALCGFDNSAARRAVDTSGFGYVIEAGLGSGSRDFRTIRFHTLPGPRTAAELWPPSSDAPVADSTAPAYAEMVMRGALDECGATLLAGKAVGAPFVGAVTACLVISEMLRKLHGGPEYEVADLDLMDLNFRTLVRRSSPSGAPNPGFIRVAPTSYAPQTR